MARWPRRRWSGPDPTGRDHHGLCRKEDTIPQGEALFAIDDQTIVLLLGHSPAFGAIAIGWGTLAVSSHLDGTITWVAELASQPDVVGVSGLSFTKDEPARSSDLSYDEGVAQRLWEVSENLTSRTGSEQGVWL